VTRDTPGGAANRENGDDAMLQDENGNPKKLFGKVEWPLALLFSTIPLLVVVALFKSGTVI